MFSKKNKKRAFTLIEMLIVIVIIGILAAALIPRLASARGRANDVARKADLSQVAAALVAFQIDNGRFPSNNGSLNSISGDLIKAGMSSIPTDPNTSRSFNGIAGVTISGGQYGYSTISKGGIKGNGFVLMGGSETDGGSNRVVTSSNDIGIGQALEKFEDIIPCKTIDQSSLNTNSNGTCTYIKGSDVLRYIYIY